MGFLKNREKCNVLGDGLFELKASSVRLVFSYDRERRYAVVVVHGFMKSSQKIPARELARARSSRERVLKAQQEGRLTYGNVAQ